MPGTVGIWQGVTRKVKSGRKWFANTREGITENSQVHGPVGPEELTPTQPQGVKDTSRKAWSPRGRLKLSQVVQDQVREWLSRSERN